MAISFPKGDLMPNVNMREYVARRIRELRVAYGKKGLSQEELAQMVAVKTAFDPSGLLNPGKVIPTLARCAEYGKQHVRRGVMPFADIPRF